MNIIKKYLLIILILGLAAILRFYNLGSYPALNADEAAIGYNAYSLIQTGKDEHGNSWPIHFQSFNDYKPGLYVYLVLPFVKFFGLSEWAVRFPNALLGVATVYLIYLLTNEMFPKKDLGFRIYDLGFGEIAALFLAISPWHLHFSRGGWEVNTATFFIVFGVLLFLKAIKKPGVLNFAFSLLHFALSLYTYHAARVITPLIGLGLVLIYRNEIFTKKNTKLLIINFFFLTVLLAPLTFDLSKGAVVSRAAGVGLFADVGPINRINEQRGEHGSLTSLFTKLTHNKPVNYGLAFLDNWSAHLHGEFLFMTGDVIQRNKVPETGQMYLFDILFLGVGFFVIARNYSLFPRPYSLVLWWLFVSPVAAALTFQAPHALRAQNMVIPLVIISAVGFVNLIGWLKGRNLKFAIWLLVFVIVWLFVRYEHLYYVHMAKEYPFSSQYGLKELANYVNDNSGKYQNVVVTDKYDQPYILFLFYTKYSPADFQKSHSLTSRDQYGFSTVREFGKFRFEPINFDTIRTSYPNSLIIGTPDEIPKEANVVKKIYGTNGYEYFRVVAN